MHSKVNQDIKLMHHEIKGSLFKGIVADQDLPASPSKNVSPSHLPESPSHKSRRAKVEDYTKAAMTDIVRTHVGNLSQAQAVSVRYHAAEALAALGRRANGARPALERVLLQDSSVHVRKSAAVALGELGDRQAEAALRHALKHDEDKFVGQRAEQALEQLFLQL